MAIKVGISGFGRIARVVIRASMDMPEIEIAGHKCKECGS